jgi:hypothetical protein
MSDGLTPRDANAGILVDQADAQTPDTDPSDAADPKTMDQVCHRCDDLLTPVTGRSDGQSRHERTGICRDCRLDGVGGATFVTLVQPSELSDTGIERLGKRQRGATAQSTASVAAFVDDFLPPGGYVARRTQPQAVTLTCPDVDITSQERRELAKRMRNIPDDDTWFVQSFPSFIRLVDTQVGAASDELAVTKTVRGP